MGKMEEESSRRTKRAHIRGAILSTVQLAGLLTIAVAVPNAIQGLHKLDVLPGRRQTEVAKRSVQRLIRSGHLRYDGKYLRLTDKGDRYLQLQKMLEFEAAEKRKWDGKWRVLTFDIPEQRKSLRDRVRRTIQGIGFMRLQDSVWVHPHDCEDLITLLKADFKIGWDMLYMIVDQLEGDRRLKEHFSLK